MLRYSNREKLPMAPIIIKFGGYQPRASIHNNAAAYFGRRLIDRLGDEVQFSLDGDIIARVCNFDCLAVDLHRLDFLCQIR